MIVLSIILMAMQVGEVRPDRVKVAIAPDETRRIEADFARCLVKIHPVEARHFVVGDLADAQAQQSNLMRAVDNRCFVPNILGEARISIPPGALRQMLANALVQAQLATTTLGDLELVAPLIHPIYNDDQFQPKAGKQYKPAELQTMAEQRAALKAGRFLSIFGECVVRMDQANALVLLNSSPTSSAEEAAIAALAPAMGQCIPEGQSLALNKESIRGNVAENYYRLAVAPRVAPVSKAAQ
ncbi:MAG: hypothetical protein ABIW33_03050 [Sphingomicrobium sp.]